MSIKLNDRFLGGFVNESEIKNMQPFADVAYNLLVEGNGPGNDFLGWVTLPEDYDREEFARIKVAAEKIKKSCDILVVIGIGGSYLGARAAIEFVKSPIYNNLKKDTPDIYFAGNNISTSALTELLSICEGKDICVNVISKSGTTTEPAIAFRVFKALLNEKYGEDGAKERIFVTTDKARGTLKEFSDKAGYETFVVPDNVGGRYSVLTAVGLLPIACAGIDIDAMMKGAQDAKSAFASSSVETNPAIRYAAIRNILSRKGKCTEIHRSRVPHTKPVIQAANGRESVDLGRLKSLGHLLNLLFFAHHFFPHGAKCTPPSASIVTPRSHSITSQPFLRSSSRM